MKIYSYMVVKNEADRYLEEVIHSIRRQVDGLFVLDDRSEDDTRGILNKLGVTYAINGGPAFIEKECEVRQEAWNNMEAFYRPVPGDWILALDADEILRTAIPLRDICENATWHHEEGIWTPIREMWNDREMRTDGWWGKIRGLRIAAYKPDGLFKATKYNMGGGSLPDYVGLTTETAHADILHFGYAKPEDRQIKFDRYSKTSGHQMEHINSILEPGMLAQLPRLI